MTTEAPRALPADACPDPEQLAAYVDGGLPPDERTVVERHLVECADCRDILTGAVAAAPSRTPVVLRPARGKWLVIGGGLLAAAAALVVVVKMQRPSPYYVPEMAELVRA